MYTAMYICIRRCTYVYGDVHVYVAMYTVIYLCIQRCTYVYGDVHMYVAMYIHVCVRCGPVSILTNVYRHVDFYHNNYLVHIEVVYSFSLIYFSVFRLPVFMTA